MSHGKFLLEADGGMGIKIIKKKTKKQKKKDQASKHMSYLIFDQ